MTTAAALTGRWSRELAAAGIAEAVLESELLYCELTGQRRAERFLWSQEEPAAETIARGEAMLVRRCRREPLYYIFGHAPFRNLELEVSPAVLIPRPETELLVDFLLRHTPEHGRILDVGTGSGAIALSALDERPDLTGLALDISPDALAVAGRNAERLQMTGRLTLRHSDLLSAVLPEERFDFIAANLPYVSETAYAGLEPEVRCYEPKLALTAPEEGMALMRRLLTEAGRYLNPGCWLLLELDGAQAAPMAAALAECGHYREIITLRDYAGIDRLVGGRTPRAGEAGKQEKFWL